MNVTTLAIGAAGLYLLLGKKDEGAGAPLPTGGEPSNEPHDPPGTNLGTITTAAALARNMEAYYSVSGYPVTGKHVYSGAVTLSAVELATVQAAILAFGVRSPKMELGVLHIVTASSARWVARLAVSDGMGGKTAYKGLPSVGSLDRVQIYHPDLLSTAAGGAVNAGADWLKGQLGL